MYIRIGTTGTSFCIPDAVRHLFKCDDTPGEIMGMVETIAERSTTDSWEWKWAKWFVRTVDSCPFHEQARITPLKVEP